MSRKRTNVSLDPNVYERAKELGINISQTTEAALQIRIKSVRTGSTADGTPAPLGLAVAQMDTATLTASVSHQLDADEFLHEFEQTCRIDRGLADSTTTERMRYATKLVEYLEGHPLTATKQDLREFIQQYDDENAVKTVRVIYGQYFDTALAESFTAPSSPPQPKQTPDKTALRAVYREINSAKHQVAFLLFATSGLRRRELMELTPADLDLDNRAIYPAPDDGQTTKRQWMTFYSSHAENRLRRVFDLEEMRANEPFFTCHPDTLSRSIKRASQRVETMTITPQLLRVWFCHEMGQLGVADRYIDAFCGRTSRTVLAKHYTDYTPENLQSIYEDAGISVLE